MLKLYVYAGIVVRTSEFLTYESPSFKSIGKFQPNLIEESKEIIIQIIVLK